MSTIAKIAIAVVLCITCVGAGFLVKQKDGTPVTTRKYSVSEEKLANEVKAYLGEYLLIEDSDSEYIADKAVKAYDTIVSSKVNTITDEHVRVLQDSIESVLNDYITDEQITYEDKEALSNGIAQIILNTIMERIEDSQYATVKEFESEYSALINSLQGQVKELQERSYKVNISTNIDKTKEEVKLSEEYLSEIQKEIQQEILEEVEDGKDGKDGKDGQDGRDGKNGINGKDGIGKDGKDGADGKDGKDGANGSATYIFFADDENGSNFSTSVTETSKYMATITTNKEAASITKEDLSGKWKKYKGLSITPVTDSDGKTTLFIN